MSNVSKLPVEQSHRNWLQSEIERIDTLLQPADRAKVAERMKVLFAALPSQDKGDSEDLRAQAYLYALEDVSLHVLDGAIKDILQGRVPDIEPVFAPTPPQLSRLCRARMDALRAERFRHQRRVHGETKQLTWRNEPSPEESARIAAKADAASAALEQAAREGDELDREQAAGVRSVLENIAAKARERAYRK